MPSPKLPYRMPAGFPAKAQYLSQLMHVPPAWLSFMPAEDACSLLSYVCLYHHLDRLERPKVLARVNALPGPKQALIRSKIVLPLANPAWGLWCLTTDELLRQHDFLETVSEAGSLMGFGLSLRDGASFFKTLRQTSAAVAMRAFLSTVAIWGFFWMNDKSKSLIQEEIFRRAAAHG